MDIIVAIRWQPNKDQAHISYMLIDKHSYKVLLQPKKFDLSKNNLSRINEILNNNFLNDVNQQTDKESITFEYKSVIKRGPKSRPRDDSVYFDGKIKSIISSYGLNNNGRLESKLKAENLKKFQETLLDLNLIDKIRGNAWKIHLWSVALHATPSKLNEILKKIKKNYENKRS